MFYFLEMIGVGRVETYFKLVSEFPFIFYTHYSSFHISIDCSFFIKLKIYFTRLRGCVKESSELIIVRILRIPKRVRSQSQWLNGARHQYWYHLLPIEKLRWQCSIIRSIYNVICMIIGTCLKVSACMVTSDNNQCSNGIYGIHFEIKIGYRWKFVS